MCSAEVGSALAFRGSLAGAIGCSLEIGVTRKRLDCVEAVWAKLRKAMQAPAALVIFMPTRLATIELLRGNEQVMGCLCKWFCVNIVSA